MKNNNKNTSEWQFDGLVGPTHNYAGLAYGNVAATSNAGTTSNPKLAALQGLEKMKFVRELGVKQAFLPPQFRPIISVLKRIGFDGSTGKILDDVGRQAPHLLASVYSSAFMWAANAATVAPSADSADGKLHLTPANLISNFHRSLESGFTTKLLRRIFRNSQFFSIHDPLPASFLFSDEGAANHMRACSTHHDPGLHIFVYGTGGAESFFGAPQRRLPSGAENAPRKYPARQQKAAFEAIARNHRLAPEACVFVQQNPEIIDQGVFHNDVITMNTTRLMIAHERAFSERDAVKQTLKKFGKDFDYIDISDDQLTVEEAVKSYFFNSQLLELEDGSFVIVAPSECQENKRARAVLDGLSGGNGPVSKVHYRDVRESMKNGGGPACLRLRVALNAEEAAQLHPGIVLSEERFVTLSAWVRRYYRDRLVLEDLRDPLLVGELEEAFAALAELLGMPDLYDL